MTAKTPLKSLVRDNICALKPYTPGKPTAEVQRELGLQEIVQISGNENFRSVHAQIVAAVAAKLHQVNRYPDGGCYYLRRELATFLGIDHQQLVFGNGGDEIISMLCETFIDPGDQIVLGDPTFIAYSISAQIAAADIVRVPLRPDFSFDLEGMLAATTPKTKLVIVCNPNNPTGAVVTHDQMDDFLERMPDTAIVLLDEAYCEFNQREDFPRSFELLQRHPRLVLLRTFSKILSLAGIRIGYGITSPEICNYLERVRKPYNVNTIAQLFARESLHYPELIRQAASENARERQYLYTAFTEMGLTFVPSESNFIYVDVQMPATELLPQMIAKGVIVRSGAAFGNPTHIRVTVSSRTQNDRFLEVLRECHNAGAINSSN